MKANSNNHFLQFIEAHAIGIFFILFIAVAVGIRIYNFEYISGDYWNFLRVWMSEIIVRGGWSSLAVGIGDYSVPYVFLLTGLSYITNNWLHGIKYISIAFDLIMAFGVGAWYYLNTPKKTTRDKDAMLIVLIVLFTPTVYMNSALWAQSDSIYTAFIVWSLVALSLGKYNVSLITYGIAFAFKLQSIFILPLYILVFFFNHPKKLYMFAWIPVIYYITALPALIAGRSFMDVTMIYFRQTGTYGSMTLNMPNLYQWFPSNFAVFAPYAISLFVLAMASMFFHILNSHYRIKKNIVILLALWSVLVTVYLLPAMHERYLYIADVLAVLYYFVERKNGWITIATIAISTLAYFPFLFGFHAFDLKYVAILYTAVVYFVTRELLTRLKQTNMEINSDA